MDDDYDITLHNLPRIPVSPADLAAANRKWLRSKYARMWEHQGGWQALAEHFIEMSQRNGLTTVSAGSGDGTVEKALIDAAQRYIVSKRQGSLSPEREAELTNLARVIERGIITVDPDPNVAAEFKTVAALARDMPQLISRCNLLLIWTLPNEANYDDEALATLRPERWTAVVDVTGSAGSSSFHTFARKAAARTPETQALYDCIEPVYKQSSPHKTNEYDYTIVSYHLVVKDNPSWFINDKVGVTVMGSAKNDADEPAAKPPPKSSKVDCATTQQD